MKELVSYVVLEDYSKENLREEIEYYFWIGFILHGNLNVVHNRYGTKYIQALIKEETICTEECCNQSPSYWHTTTDFSSVDGNFTIISKVQKWKKRKTQKKKVLKKKTEKKVTVKKQVPKKVRKSK